MAGAAILLSVVAGMGISALRADGLTLLPLSPEARLVEGFASGVASTAPVREIDIDEALRLLDGGGAVFVDARAPEFYELGHVPSSRSLSRSNFRRDVPAFMRDIERERKLVVYCSEEECRDSAVVAGALKMMGYKNVSVFRGGWAEWKAAELPEEAGAR